MKLTCVCCKQSEETENDRLPGAFWFLQNYFGLHGKYCAKCYEKVSHDGHGNPKHPEEYLMILLRQENGNGKKAKS